MTSNKQKYEYCKISIYGLDPYQQLLKDAVPFGGTVDILRIRLAAILVCRAAFATYSKYDCVIEKH
jgi:hypothetical protein